MNTYTRSLISLFIMLSILSLSCNKNDKDNCCKKTSNKHNNREIPFLVSLDTANMLDIGRIHNYSIDKLSKIPLEESFGKHFVFFYKTITQFIKSNDLPKEDDINVLFNFVSQNEDGFDFVSKNYKDIEIEYLNKDLTKMLEQSYKTEKISSEFYHSFSKLKDNLYQDVISDANINLEYSYKLMSDLTQITVRQGLYENIILQTFTTIYAYSFSYWYLNNPNSFDVKNVNLRRPGGEEAASGKIALADAIGGAIGAYMGASVGAGLGGVPALILGPLGGASGAVGVSALVEDHLKCKCGDCETVGCQCQTSGAPSPNPEGNNGITPSIDSLAQSLTTKFFNTHKIIRLK